MSGSNSSVPEGLAAENLHLTVHSMPAPDLNQRRTRTGRLKMLLVLAICAAPVVASYLTYFVIRPQARTNYGTLILPTRPLPAEGWQRLDGSTLPDTALKGQWLLVTVSGASCDAACDRRLFMQRQLREMLGRERDRLDKVWIVMGAGDPPPALRAAAESVAGMQIVRAERDLVARWLQPEPGHALEEHLYLVDPMGEWMMRMPADADPAKVKRDLERLMRASAGWDKPGR